MSLSISEKGKHYKGFVKFVCVFLVVNLALSVVVNAEGSSIPKDFRYEKKCGKLKKVRKKVKCYRRILAWLAKQMGVLLSKAMMILLVTHILGLLDVVVGLVVLWLTMREILLKIARICPKHKILNSTIVTSQKILMVALVGAIFLGMPQECEAFSCAVVVQSSQSATRTIATAVGASELIQSEVEVFLDKVELIRKRYKISLSDQIAIYKKLCENPDIPSSEILRAFKHVKISESQLNRIRREWELSRRKGRPASQGDSQYRAQRGILGKAGVSLFATWLEENKEHEKVLETIYELIKQYKRDHPDEKFRLLVSRKKTIEKKWKALAILPLLDIGKLSELDYKQHNMQQILGYSYGYSALRQFLGELERINAGSYLKKILAKSAKGQYCYIDGHLIAFWTRLSMHKGYITNKGKIMPGSNVVLAHDENGKAIALEFHPPDIHLSHIIEKYCHEIVAQTNIRRFIIDREINSPKIARLFIKNGWELLCLLGANDYKDENCFSKKFATRDSDGVVFYKGDWKKYREDDPRKFVIVKEPERCIVYWGTPKIVKLLRAQELVEIYRKRTEIQENGIKRLIAHQKLDTNFGTKKIIGPDRTHQRKLDKIDEQIQSLSHKEQKATAAFEQQQQKVQESHEKGHGKRLESREAKLLICSKQRIELQESLQQAYQKKIDCGPAGERADRDFRKQTIMAFRSLYVENLLLDFLSLLSANLPQPVGSETLLELFFFRNASVFENHNLISYRFDGQSLSSGNRLILKNVIAQFNTLSLTSGGKNIIAQYIGFP